VGFGKSSVETAIVLEKLLGAKITSGAVIGIAAAPAKYIETFAGTHPLPSPANMLAGEKIYNIVKDANEEDLIIALVSGGGSALLCYGENECLQGGRLYSAFLKSGKTIAEINTVRKHLSLLKGGGLAKLAYPATVVGLIFSDVPGEHYENVASGPTYKDDTTILDAEKIIQEYNLGQYNLVETPKEDKYFEKVHNIVLISNKTAVEAMEKKAIELGLTAKVISSELYDEGEAVLEKIFNAAGENTAVLAAGEPSIKVPEKAGKGGRNLHLSLLALKNKIKEESDAVFISIASDGHDNTDAAGAIVDKLTLEKVKKQNLNIEDYINRFDSYSFFQQTKDIIQTGPTGANVSDLMILLNRLE
jgi:glycerate-2-kinase